MTLIASFRQTPIGMTRGYLLVNRYRKLLDTQGARMAKRTYHTPMRLSARCWPCTGRSAQLITRHCLWHTAPSYSYPQWMLYGFRQFMPTSPARWPRCAIVVICGEPGHRRPPDLKSLSSSSAGEPFYHCPFTAAFKGQSGTGGQPWGTKCRPRRLPIRRL